MNQTAVLTNQHPSLQGKPSLNALTGLRIFAALSVVIYHFSRPALTGWPSPLIHLAGTGYVAVSFFFLLSGFLLSYSYLGERGQLRGTRRSFYVARFARIYPAYLLAFLLALPFNVISSLHVNHAATAAAKLLASAAAVLSLQQAWTPWTAWSWNFPAWSVSVEAFFYLMFPWLGPRLARLRPSMCLAAASGLWLLSLCAPALLVLLKGSTGAPGLGDHLQMAIEFNPLLRLPEFVIGILLGRAYSRGLPFRLRGGILSYCSIACILSILAFCPSIPHPLLASGLLIPLFGLLTLSLAQGEGGLSRLLSLQPLVILGEASYGVYILQIPVSYVLRVPPPHTSLRTFALYLLVLLAVAVFSWRFIEVPSRARLRRWLTKEKSDGNRLKTGSDAQSPETIPLNQIVG